MGEHPAVQRRVVLPLHVDDDGEDEDAAEGIGKAAVGRVPVDDHEKSMFLRERQAMKLIELYKEMAR